MNHTIYSVVFTSAAVAGMEPVVVALAVGILVILLVMVVVKNHRGEFFFCKPSPSVHHFCQLWFTFAIIGAKYEQALL